MKNKILNVAIAGTGYIGGKRFATIASIGQDNITGIFDINQARAQHLANPAGTKVYKSWKELLADKSVEAVIIATTTDVNVKMVREALAAGKHVLAEKPLGRNSAEARKIFFVSKKHKRVVKVGFNHRFHPALMKAHQLVGNGAIGKILFIRGVYGHGARPGYDTEWRMQKKYSSGGELLDQGVHLIDLASWFMGGFSKVFAQTRSFYWRKSPLEDNAFCLLMKSSGEVATFHVSLTQWRNKFSFEIFGDEGYLLINGLGQSYGEQTLTYGSKVGRGQRPQEEILKFPGPDESWLKEWEEFRSSVLAGRQPVSDAKENLAINRVLEALYLSAKRGKIIKLANKA